MALFSYNDRINEFIVSVVHIGQDASADQGFYDSLMASVVLDYGLDKSYSSHNENPALINFTIINDPEKAFAKPGSENVEMMGFSFKTEDDSLIIEDLRLKVVGVDREFIEKAMVLDEKEIIKMGKADGDYFVFKGLNYEIPKDSKETLFLYVSMSPDITTGNRFRMDIEDSEDISLVVGSHSYSIDAYYPIEGKYLSVAKPRPWGIDRNKKD